MDFMRLEIGSKCIPYWFELLAMRAPAEAASVSRAVSEDCRLTAGQAHPPGGVYLYKPSSF
jgi:hypothetical protein